MGRGAAADGAGAGKVMIDLAAHRRALRGSTVSARSGAARGGGVGDHGQRGLERMGEVAGMAARLLGLLLAMREQLVDLVDQRLDFAAGSPRRCGSACRERIATTSRPHPAQRPQPVERLQRGEHRAGRRRARRSCATRVERNSLICSSIMSRDWATWKRQRTSLPGRIDVALDDAQRLAGELAAVVGMEVDVVVTAVDSQARGPTASATGRCRRPAPLIWK